MEDHREPAGVSWVELVVPDEVVFRVKGRVDPERWAEWFEGMSVVECERGETEIRGPVADQATMYGMIARLRDLAAPLVSVNRVAPPAGPRGPDRELARVRQPLRPRWFVIVVAALLAGGLASLTTFLASEGVLEPSLAIALMFGALAAVARWGQRNDGGWVWGVILITMQAAALITLVVFLAAQRGMHAGLAVAILCFVPAGLLLRAAGRRG